MLPKYIESTECRIAAHHEYTDKRWSQRYELLLNFIAQFHRLPRCSDKYKGFSLGHWCNKQILYSKNPDYPAERREKLEEIGLLEKSQDAKWNYRLSLFHEFATQFNHTPKYNENYKGENIGYWYRSTLEKVKNGTISEARKENLQKVGKYFGF